VVEVKVNNKREKDDEDIFSVEKTFDFLNTGSCFCAYSFLCEDAMSMMKF
jgi:hypothetical protein